MSEEVEDLDSVPALPSKEPKEPKLNPAPECLRWNGRHRKHFKKRAKERFDLDISDEEFDKINRMILHRYSRLNDPYVIRLGLTDKKLSHRHGILIWFKTAYYFVVWDTKLNSVVTVLPSENLNLAKTKGK